jgi:hypothetical protein
LSLCQFVRPFESDPSASFAFHPGHWKLIWSLSSSKMFKWTRGNSKIWPMYISKADWLPVPVKFSLTSSFVCHSDQLRIKIWWNHSIFPCLKRKGIRNQLREQVSLGHSLNLFMPSITAALTFW